MAAKEYIGKWFTEKGAYVLVDGQFGSTGKGLLAGWLAEYAVERGLNITHVTTNAGPNSGHTAFFDHVWAFTYADDPRQITGSTQKLEKVVTQQIPVASVFLKKMGRPVTTLLNAGAIIDEGILLDEFSQYGFNVHDLLIHPNAAVIHPQDRFDDQNTLNAIAGTGKGIGPALQRKVSRLGASMAREKYRPMLPAGQPRRSWDSFWDWKSDTVFVETAQGFSLGINSRFYPYTTSRECTVQQAIADARIPAQMVQGVVACFRSFPIRVGNTAGSSGECYADQRELTWEDIGVEPEMTTVTKRVRRVFSWSRIQFKECIAVNRPDMLFLNFMNYLSEAEQRQWLDTVVEDYTDVIGKAPTRILGGYGPNSEDIRVIW